MHSALSSMVKPPHNEAPQAGAYNHFSVIDQTSASLLTKLR
jgi:hypothetical protein